MKTVKDLKQAMPRKIANYFVQLLWTIWASPTSVVALFVACLGIPTGTRLRWRGTTLEAYGGLINRILELVPVSAVAMTLGHVIWGRSPEILDECREHEMVHVRQYERWGPFFIPMYLGFSLWLWWQGKDAYYENPFEKEAYGTD